MVYLFFILELETLLLYKTQLTIENISPEKIYMALDLSKKDLKSHDDQFKDNLLKLIEAKIKSSELDINRQERLKLSKDLYEELYSSKLEFKSVYSTYTFYDPSYKSIYWEGEPKFTTYSLYKGTLDYILYSYNSNNSGLSLIPEQILELPSESDLDTGIPNRIYPSDHISLCCIFKLF